MKLIKRKKTPSQPSFQTILCIPGNWTDASDLVSAIIKATDGKFLFGGLIMINVESGFSCEVDVCESDERMAASFRHTGSLTGISQATIDQIEDHKTVVYLRATTGTFNSAMEIAQAGGALLKAGGIALKVETAGKGFDKERWLNCLEDLREPDLYDMMVVDSLANDDGTFCSCGMQNFGLKDTMVANEDFQDAVDLIRIFSFYQIVDKPTIYANQTFGLGADAPSYYITEELNQPYKDIEIFGNPFGMWRLQRK
jgi:hypothetical protein